ncbi:hypothetical protein DF044_01810 [Burkholderia contaminans]|uniref:hypothetical protein n=1 Tax=Burkholderia contaminans TaxID=488447 RepID=UPI000F5980E2|nr:hypothetical protein [Burkholderia contaminans]RQT19423.1 hypothetical protein DF044_01810 [Burkholderia contaminans]
MSSPFKTSLILSESDHKGVGLLLKEVGEQVICEFDKTPQTQEHAIYIRDAVNEHPALLRKQEIIFDLSFTLGNRWHTFSDQLTGDILDHYDGSRGLSDLVKTWADEFDADWESRSDDEQQNYLGDVDEFANRKIAELVDSVKRPEPPPPKPIKVTHSYNRALAENTFHYVGVKWQIVFKCDDGSDFCRETLPAMKTLNDVLTFIREKCNLLGLGGADIQRW